MFGVGYVRLSFATTAALKLKLSDRQTDRQTFKYYLNADTSSLEEAMRAMSVVINYDACLRGCERTLGPIARKKVLKSATRQLRMKDKVNDPARSFLHLAFA